MSIVLGIQIKALRHQRLPLKFTKSLRGYFLDDFFAVENNVSFATNIKKLLIYSAGDFAREMAWVAQSVCENPDALEIIFIDDNVNLGDQMVGFPIINYERAKLDFTDWPMVNAIGDPKSRKKVAARCIKDGFKHISLKHPSAQIGPRNVFGDGCVISANCSITCDIIFGNNVTLNLNCTVGHDTVIGDNVSISPMTSISGRVIIEKNVNLGSGVTIINGKRGKPLIIGEGSTVGAGSVVVKNVPSNTIVVGVPAKPLGQSNYAFNPDKPAKETS